MSSTGIPLYLTHANAAKLDVTSEEFLAAATQCQRSIHGDYTFPSREVKRAPTFPRFKWDTLTCNTGDLLLCVGRGQIADVIRKSCASYSSHVVMLVQNGSEWFLWQCTHRDGITLSPLTSEYFDQYDEVYYCPLKNSVPALDRMITFTEIHNGADSLVEEFTSQPALNKDHVFFPFELILVTLQQGKVLPSTLDIRSMSYPVCFENDVPCSSNVTVCPLRTVYDYACRISVYFANDSSVEQNAKPLLLIELNPPPQEADAKELCSFCKKEEREPYSCGHSLACKQCCKSINYCSHCGRDVRHCIFCQTNDRQVSFEPCGHAVSCARCAVHVKYCPACGVGMDRAVLLQ